MPRISRFYWRLAVLYGVAGLTLGTFMGATQDFTLTTIHVHLGLLGWFPMAVYALFFGAVPAAAEGRLAWAQFGLANAGLVALLGGVALIVTGGTQVAEVAAPGSLLSLASMLCFAVIVLRHTGSAAQR